MNERTKDVNQRVYDIWRQAASTVSPLKTGGDWQKDFVKEFAELIVRECVKVMYDDAIERKVPPDINQTPTHYVVAVLKHFGVEE